MSDRSSPHPSAAALLRLSDGEATQNEAAALRDHLDGCASCRLQSAELARLTSDLAAPLASPDGLEARTESLLLAIAAGATPRPAPRRLRAASIALASVAAAAALLLYPRLDRRSPRGQGQFDARGGAAGTQLSRSVGVNVYAPLAHHVPLRNGARVAASTLFTAAYRNLDRAQDVYLLVFAVDARGEKHWLYPEFSDAHSDPAAVRLPMRAAETAFADSVALDQPALGTLRIFCVLSRQPMHVSDVEPLDGTTLDSRVLERRLPNSHVDEIDVELTASAEGVVP